MRWDEWRGSLDGRPTMWIKGLASWRGFNVELHKIVAGDDPDCFHTHPAWAIRFILWGGYVEERYFRRRRRWFPGRVGIVSPRYCHRIDRTLWGASYSLWLRFPKCAEVRLVGRGWPPRAAVRRDVELQPGYHP